MAIDILVPVVTRRDTYAGRCRRIDLVEIYEKCLLCEKSFKVIRTLFEYSEFRQYKGLPPIRFRRKHTDEEFVLLYDINTSKEP